DHLKISREKLAYLVDSTAAPVAGVAIISTWIAAEIGYINDAFDKLGLAERVNGFDIFVQTIPYRFYALLALVFVPMVALLGRDFGAMLKAERKARLTDGTKPNVKPTSNVTPARASHWLNAVLPIVTMLAVTTVLLFMTGLEAVAFGETSFYNVFSSGNSYIALLYGSLAGLLTAVLMTILQKLMSLKELAKAVRDGAKTVLLALAILWLAWTLSGITTKEHLGTDVYLGGLLQGNVPIQLMPTLVFVLASFVAFATGTSWGTMGILMPLAVRVTYTMLQGDNSAVSPSDPIMLASVGSVLAGAIFGDHCSPISDTTVVSSQASGCDHMAHVWTQLPYALVVGAVAILCGTLPIGFGVSVWVLLPLGVLVLFVFLRLVGRRVEDDNSTLGAAQE
ncbi:MAG: hypothetical protein IH991_20340, partial [Planctomycetes bacterium]|nr:hypothetical protein [Planctomycetota bacterium]